MKLSAKNMKAEAPKGREDSVRRGGDRKIKKLCPVQAGNVSLSKIQAKPQAPSAPKQPVRTAAARKTVRKASGLNALLKINLYPVPSANKVVQMRGPKATVGKAHVFPKGAPKLVRPKEAEQLAPILAPMEEPTVQAESLPHMKKDCLNRAFKKEPKTAASKLLQPKKDSDSKKALVKFDLLKRYLSEIGKYRLLTRDEERAYGIRVKEQGDNDAAYVLVTANLRLVVKIALQFQRMWMQNLLDLIQEGNIGLMQAVKKFDPYMNVKFSYYASFWIKAYILKFIMDNWRLVKIGTTQGQRKLFFKLQKEKQRVIEQGYDPNPKLLSERLGVSEREIVDMDQRLGRWDVSLNAPLSDDSKTERIEFLETDADSVEDLVSKKQMRVMLRGKILEFRKKMSPREVEIFDLRIFSDNPVTLQTIGDRYQISRERVRQVEKDIIRKMRDFFKREIPDFASYSGDSGLKNTTQQVHQRPEPGSGEPGDRKRTIVPRGFDATVAAQIDA